MSGRSPPSPPSGSGDAAFSRRLDGTVVTPAIIFVGAGVVLRSDALGLIEVAPTGLFVKPLAEATLGPPLAVRRSARLSSTTTRRTTARSIERPPANSKS